MRNNERLKMNSIGRVGAIMLLLLLSLAASAQQLVFAQGHSLSAIPLTAIDSMKLNPPQGLLLFCKDKTLAVTTDTISLKNMKQSGESLADTIIVNYHGETVTIINPRLDRFQVFNDGAYVSIISSGRRPFVCVASGQSSDGRLVIDNDTTMTLIIDNLSLSSERTSAVYLRQKHEVRIVMPSGSASELSDAAEYHLADTTDISSACLYSRGSLTFSGGGALMVTGKYRYAIASSKNIKIEGGNVSIAEAVKDGVHCDKLKMVGGALHLNVSNNGAKGVKSKEAITVSGGTIDGVATGNVVIDSEATTYCTLLKSDGSLEISGGVLRLCHYGCGGRCISADGNVSISGGTINLECHGEGGYYSTPNGEIDYFTPKCITVNGTTHIERGQLNLLATGSGGKGLNCSGTLFVGRENDSFLPEDSLLIQVETRGSALVDNIEEDYRKGCPKAIKSDSDITLYSGTLRLKTHGQGGEGLECKQSLKAYYCTIVSDTYDDGINTGQRCHINGAHIFCLSHHNDGIDSNGKISILDGIVAAISEDGLNESFDTEGGCMYLYGGHVMGIGNNDVPVGEQSTVPYYSTQLKIDDRGRRTGDGISIESGNFLTVVKDGNAILSLFHDYANGDAFIIVASPQLQFGQSYQLFDGEKPAYTSAEWLDGKWAMGGSIGNQESIFTIKL